MKPLLILTLILALIAPAQSFAAQPEKVITLSGSYWTDTGLPDSVSRSIEVWLRQGWTIKHQSVALAFGNAVGCTYIIIITLSPPPDAPH